MTALQNAEGANLDAISAVQARISAGGPGGAPAAWPGVSANNPVARLLNGPRHEGGTIRPRFDGSVRAWELGDQRRAEASDQILGSDVAAHVRDVPRQDGTTGFTRTEIETVKQRVFFAEHRLDIEDGQVVTGRFDPNASMAEAWLRLRAGTFKPQDVTHLLEHELAEHRYWQQHPRALYAEAHATANRHANWEKDIPASTRADYSKPWR